MIQQIKRRFLILAMGSFSTVMFLMMVSLMTVNYFQTVQRMDSQAGFYLSMHFEDYPDVEEIRESIEDLSEDDKEDRLTAVETPNAIIGLGKILEGNSQGINKEPGPHFRYFYQVFDSSGSLEATYFTPFAGISPSQAEGLAKSLLTKEQESGWIEGMRYYKTSLSGGQTVIMIVDVSGEMNGMMRVSMVAIGVLLFVLLVVYIILKVFSNKAIQPIVQNIERQKEFISNASHEIKTPLAILLTNNDVIEMLGTQNEWTQSNRNQIKRLNALVEQMLLLARFDEGKAALEKSKVDIVRIVNQYIEEVSTLADYEGKQLVIDIPEGTIVFCHEASLNQLLNVLLENAIKYHVGDRAIEIKWYPSKKALWVINETESMTQEESERLFERFYRRDTARNREHGGSGIGLSLAQSISVASGIEISNKLIEENQIAFILKF